MLLVQSTIFQAIVGALALLIDLCATNNSKSALKSLCHVNILGVGQNSKVPMVNRLIKRLGTCGIYVIPYIVGGGAHIQKKVSYMSRPNSFQSNPTSNQISLD